MSMRSGWALLAMMGALAAPAWAQDEEPSDGATGGGGGGKVKTYDFESDSVEGELVRPPDEPVRTMEPVTMEAPPAPAPAGPTGRPMLRSVGIGAGFVFPADITLPTTVSVRFRWSDALALEPSLTLAAENQSTEQRSATGVATEDKVDSIDVEVASLVRWRLAARGKIDLLGLIGPFFRYSKTIDDDNGPNNENQDSSISIGASWGLGIEFFPRSYWSFSFDAQNPLVSYASSERDLAVGSDRTQTTISYGLVFDPTVRLMAHLYF